MFAGALVADLRLPALLPVPVERDHAVPPVARAGDDDLVLPNDRRGAALGRQFGFPLHLFFVVELRDITTARDGSVFGCAAPVRPIRLRALGQAGQRQTSNESDCF